MRHPIGGCFLSIIEIFPDARSSVELKSAAGACDAKVGLSGEIIEDAPLLASVGNRGAQIVAKLAFSSVVVNLRQDGVAGVSLDPHQAPTEVKNHADEQGPDEKDRTIWHQPERQPSRHTQHR